MSSAKSTAFTGKKNTQRHMFFTIQRTANCIGIGFLSIVVVKYLMNFGISNIFVPYFNNINVSQNNSNFPTYFRLIIYLFAFLSGILAAKTFLKQPTALLFPLKKVPNDILIVSIPICMFAMVIGVFFTNLLSVLLIKTTGYTPVLPAFSRPTGILANIVYFISMAILPAVFEELLCRGIVLQSLKKYGKHFALIVSAFMFGLMHENLAQAPYAIIVGLVMGYFVLATDSLLPSMLAHFVNNGLSVLLQWISMRVTANQYQTIQSSLSMFYIVSGLLGIIYLIIFKKIKPLEKSPPAILPESKKHIAFLTSFAIIIYIVVNVSSTIKAMKLM